MASIAKYNTTNGPRWRVQYYDPTKGKRQKRGFLTKTQAQAWADKNATTINEGDWINPTMQRTPLAEIGDTWITQQTHLKPSTLRVVTISWKKHVRPRWGNTPVGNITKAAIQTWVSTEMDASPTTIRRNHGTLAQVLDMAKDLGHIKTNPARGITLPRKTPAKKIFLTIDQVRTLADECHHNGEIVWVLATTGIRFSELAGLKVEDVDLTRGRLHIERAAVTAGQYVHIGTPKTHERRSVAVPRFVCEMIAPIIESKALADWVWCRDNGEPLFLPSTGSWFYEAVARLQAPRGREAEREARWSPARRQRAAEARFPSITIHGLRHVAAGLLVSAGANVKVVQRQLGHASAAMTLDTYSALFDGDLDEISAAMDSLVGDVGRLRAV
ncbi:site-specific integrase [Corynebacterium parakroppenstedtii]